MKRVLDDFLLNYELLSVLRDNERSYVSLVEKIETKKKYIKKVVKNRDVSRIYKLIQSINHKCIPNIEVVEYMAPNTYIIEEYVIGESLEERIARLGRLESEEVNKIILQLCDVLMVMHNMPQSIIHRDIKPSNIICESNKTIKLIDFDIARIHDKDKNKDTRMFGTEGYASPEQYGYQQTDTRSDIYSLGVLLSVVLSGEEPDMRNATYHGRYKKIIKKCTEINPEDRYQTVEEVGMEFIWSYRNRKRIIFFLLGLIFITTFVIFDRKNTSKGNSDENEVQNDVQNNETDGSNKTNEADNSNETNKESNYEQTLKPIPTKTPLQIKYECYNTNFEYEKYRDSKCKDVYADLTESVSNEQAYFLDETLKKWYSETYCDSGAWINMAGDRHIITSEFIDGKEYGIVYMNDSHKGDADSLEYIEIYWYYLNDINKRIYYSKWSDKVSYMELYHNYYNESVQYYYSIDPTFDYGPDAG